MFQPFLQMAEAAWWGWCIKGRFSFWALGALCWIAVLGNKTCQGKGPGPLDSCLLGCSVGYGTLQCLGFSTIKHEVLEQGGSEGKNSDFDQFVKERVSFTSHS